MYFKSSSQLNDFINFDFDCDFRNRFKHANGMTDEQLTTQRFREVTLLHPTWFYHRSVWERVGGYTEDTSVGEDCIFPLPH